MSEQTARARPAIRRPRLALGTVVGRVLALSLALTVLIAAGLSIQLAAGNDPTLGPKLAAAERKPTSAPVATTSLGGDGLVIVPPASVPVQSVPVQTAPVPTAPAPVQTSTS
jgi:hypothetical protein